MIALRAGSLGAAILLASVALAAGTADDPRQVLEGAHDITWDATPATVLRRLDPGTTVVWLGRVQELRAYADPAGETVLDLHCLYIPLARRSPGGLASPIAVEKETTERFLVSLRSPKMPLSRARQLSEEARRRVYYALISGEPIGVRRYQGRPAVLVDAHKTIFSDALKLREATPKRGPG